MAKFNIRPRKWIAQFQAQVQRRMQIVLFLCFFLAEVAASAALFRIAPQSPVCVWYPNGWLYAMGHFVTTILIFGVVAIVWWMMGNPAVWESICRTRQRKKTLFQAGLAGLAIDLVSTLLLHYVSTMDAVQLSNIILPWLLLRAGLWAIAYAASGSIVLWLLKLELKSRRAMPAVDSR